MSEYHRGGRGIHGSVRGPRAAHEHHEQRVLQHEHRQRQVLDGQVAARRPPQHVHRFGPFRGCFRSYLAVIRPTISPHNASIYFIINLIHLVKFRWADFIYLVPVISVVLYAIRSIISRAYILIVKRSAEGKKKKDRDQRVLHLHRK